MYIKLCIIIYNFIYKACIIATIKQFIQLYALLLHKICTVIIVSFSKDVNELKEGIPFHKVIHHLSLLFNLLLSFTDLNMNKSSYVSHVKKNTLRETYRCQ